MNVLLNPKNKKNHTKSMIGFLRHGNTDSNKEGDKLKTSDEPLSQDELICLNDNYIGGYKEGTIAYEANKFRQMILAGSKINIYFPVSIYRCVQTARIFCKVAGVDGFPDDNTISQLKELYKKGDEFSLKKAFEIESQFPANIIVEDGLKTREKGDITKIEQKNLLGGDTIHGEESSAGSIERAGRSVKRVLSNIQSSTEQGTYNIMIGHRTGMEAFEVLQYNKPIMQLHPKSQVGQFNLGSINNDNKFINQESNRFFEFTFEDYEKQYVELETIGRLNISKENSLIENQNIVNEYLANFKGHLFLTKEPQEDKEEKIKKYLYGENKLLQRYTVYALLDTIENQTGLDAKSILIDRIDTCFSSESSLDLEEQIDYFKEFYNNKNTSNLWKYILHQLKTQDNNISDELGGVSDNQDIKKELEMIDYREASFNPNVKTLFGEKPLNDIYIEQNILDKKGESTSIDKWLSQIVSNDRSCELISGLSGEGKSILSHSISSKLSDPGFIHKENLGNVLTKKIDLNKLPNNFNMQDLLDEDLLKNKNTKLLFIFDGLDEKSQLKVSKLEDIILNNTEEKYKFILLSRYFDNKFKDKLKSNNNQVSLNKFSNSDIKEFISKYSDFFDEEDKEVFTEWIYQVIEKIGKENVSPIILEMLLSIATKRNNYYRIFHDKDVISREDIYDMFLENLHEREFDKKFNKERLKNEERSKSPFLHPKYDRSKKVILMTFVDQMLKQKDPMHIKEFNLNKYEKPDEDDLHNPFYRESISDYKYRDFMTHFLSFLEDEDKMKFTKKLELPEGVKFSTNGIESQKERIFDLDFFESFLEYLTKTGFLEEKSNCYSLGIQKMHQSLYDYIGHKLVKNKSINEFYVNFLNIQDKAREDITQRLTDSHYMSFDDIFFVRRSSIFEYLPINLQKEIDDFSPFDIDDDEDIKKEEKRLLEKVNQFYPEFIKKDSRIFKNMHDYLKFRFFDSKKDLIPLLNRLKENDELKDDMGSYDYHRFISNRLEEVIGNGDIDYNFFYECDLIDEKKSNYKKQRKSAITFLEQEDAVKEFTEKILNTVEESGNTMLYYKLSEALKLNNNPLSPAYSSVITEFNIQGNNHEVDELFSIEEKNKIFHLIQLAEIKRRGGDKEYYLTFQKDNLNKFSEHSLESEFSSEFNFLYKLSDYIYSVDDQEAYITEINNIKEKINKASSGKKVFGDLKKEIIDTTDKYGFNYKNRRDYDELPSGFYHTLFSSKRELITNKYFGFA